MEKVLMEFTENQKSTIQKFSDSKGIPKVRIFRLFCDLLDGMNHDDIITIVVSDSEKIRVSNDMRTVQDYSGPHIKNFTHSSILETKEDGTKKVSIETGVKVER